MRQYLGWKFVDDTKTMIAGVELWQMLRKYQMEEAENMPV
ncbi:hypothetical protein BTN49_0150 [Candidatus Enterovibrio escicola]|uniref:Uncharacterized protein n=1 Tax=Candidatus Enterovibrio escicola TaxID=1927127 RepID=A0A2A5T7Q1_9GAMM|nr:hypothetical protein BTN49_0150 [Candidatus Enterovibrio escacola]